MKSPAVRFYVSDFLTGTDHMSSAEVGLYIRLLCYAWLNGCLPDDDMALSRLGRWEVSGEIPNGVKKKFVKGDDGMLRNPRLELERQKQQEFSDQQRTKSVGYWGQKKSIEAKAVVQTGASNGRPPEAVKKEWAPSDAQRKVMAWFKRKPEIKWSEKELKAWRSIEMGDDDLEVLDRYYTASHPNGSDYRRKDLCTLLNNWNGEVDRARQWTPVITTPDLNRQKEDPAWRKAAV